MGSAQELVDALIAQAVRRDQPLEEREGDLLALPSGEFIRLFPESEQTPQVIAQASDQVWD